MNREINRLKNNETCTGCGACASICQENCIEMRYDHEGFIFPLIRAESCVECGRCSEICQAIDSIPGEKVGAVSFNLAAEYEIQKDSASGGVFYVLAKQFIERGQYVAGAVWKDGIYVQHVVSNRISDVERMRRSKYVQSEIGSCYKEVRLLLEEGNEVLFSGTSCQIAGLKAYLGKEYEKLLCVGIICLGVSSSSLLRHHILRYSDDEIEQVDFRNRDKIGVGIGLYVRFKSGKEIVKRGMWEDSYIYQYSMDMICRRSCYKCRFRNNYPCDVLIGDAGQIQHFVLKNEMMERSVVFPLSDKGRKVVFGNLDRFRFIGHSLLDEIIASNNNSIIKSETENIILRNQVFDSTMCNGDSPHFDVLLATLWAPNYGTVLTNYSLYKAVENMGYSVVALAHSGNGVPKYCGGFLPKGNRDFIAENMTLSYQYMENTDMKGLADIVLLPSDILWNEYIMRDYDSFQVYSLNWWNESVRKISYAVSIGTRDGFPIERKALFAKALDGFSAISLREKSGVDWIKESFHKDATHVLDPVFLLGREHYDRICRHPAGVSDKPELVLYVLRIDEEWAYYINELKRATKKKITLIAGWEFLECNRWEISKYGLDSIVTPRLDITEWLWYIKNAECIMTNSWHGACFSVIFEKKMLVHTEKMTDRFDTLSEITELSEHFREQKNVVEDIHIMYSQINYKSVYDILQTKRRESHDWLKTAIKGDI